MHEGCIELIKSDSSLVYCYKKKKMFQINDTYSSVSPGACIMMVAEQTQGYRISFELIKPNQSNLALLVPWSWSSTFFVNSGFDPEVMEHVTSVMSSQSHALKLWFTSRERVGAIHYQRLKDWTIWRI